MTTLPKSLSPERLLNRELPGDITLAEATRFLNSLDFVKQYHLHGRFLDEHGQPYPDTMKLSAFQKLAAEGKGRIALDDGEGGALVPA